MRVKAQSILNALSWVEQTHGQRAVAEVLAECSQAVRDRYIASIAIEWIPLSEFVEVLGVCEKRLGKGDGRIAEQIGAAGARANLRGATQRAAFYVLKPSFLGKRVAGLWDQYNDEGAMTIHEARPELVRVEVVGIVKPDWLFCCTLTGWCGEFALATGSIGARPVHTECRAKGAARCLWDVRPIGGNFAA